MQLESGNGVPTLRTCHGAYRSGAGWVVPMGHLLTNGNVEPLVEVSRAEGIAVDAETGEVIFSDGQAICAPG